MQIKSGKHEKSVVFSVKVTNADDELNREANRWEEMQKPKPDDDNYDSDESNSDSSDDSKDEWGEEEVEKENAPAAKRQRVKSGAQGNLTSITG